MPRSSYFNNHDTNYYLKYSVTLILQNILRVLRYLPTIPLPGGGIPPKIGECVEQENWIERATKIDKKPVAHLQASSLFTIWRLTWKQNSELAVPYQPTGHDLLFCKLFSIEHWTTEASLKTRVTGFPGSGWMLPFAKASLHEEYLL